MLEIPILKSSMTKILKVLLCVGLSSLLPVQTVQAQAIIPAPPQLAASSYLLIDVDTGKVLVERNSDEQVPPASLTKMMTSYIVSAEINSGSVSYDDQADISVKAWRMGGSKMFVREGTKVPVEDLLRGVIIQSGNDASVALAEHVAGSEEAFVDMMNQQAALLGMDATQFQNATGWPAEDHYTTARDLSLLARALIIDYPKHYALYSEKYFSYGAPGEKVIKQENRNKLLFRDKTVDGIKTGHTDEAGYCLVASAKKKGMRLVTVVMGTRSEAARAAESQKLLAYGFRFFQTHKLYSADQVLSEARVWGGQNEQVRLTLADDLVLTIPRGAGDALKVEMHVNNEIKAPFAKGAELGDLVVSLNGEQLADVPLVAADSVEEAGFFARLIDIITLFILGLFR